MPKLQLEFKPGSKNRLKIALLLVTVFIFGLIDGIRNLFDYVFEDPLARSEPWHGQLSYQDAVNLHNDGWLELLPDLNTYLNHKTDINKKFKDIMPPPGFWPIAFFVCLLMAIILSFTIRWWIFIPGVLLAIVISAHITRLMARDISEALLNHEDYYQHLTGLGILRYRLAGAQSLSELAGERGLTIMESPAEAEKDQDATRDKVE